MKRHILKFPVYFLAVLIFTEGLFAQDVDTVGFVLSSSSGDESVNIVQLAVRLANYKGSTVNVEYTLSGAGSASDGNDFSFTPGNFIFTGDGTQLVNITITDDALHENNETIRINLAYFSGAVPFIDVSSHTYTINNNDAVPNIDFTSTSGSGNEGTAAGNMQVRINTPSGLSASVNYTVTGGSATGSGVDYSLASGTATITAGATTTNITATVINDALAEPNETIVVTLTPASEVNSTITTNNVHTFTINDNDTDPTIDFTVAASSNDESVTAATIQLRLSAVSGKNISVNYGVAGTSTAADHNLTANVATITAGQTTVDINVTVTDDALDEDNETILLTLTSPTNATLGTNTGHTYTIQDDDATPTVTFSTANASGAENVTPGTFQLDLSAVSGRNVTVAYAVTGGTATGSGTDYTLADGTASITAALACAPECG